MGSINPHLYLPYPMGIGFCPIMYPRVEKSFHTRLGFRVPIAIPSLHAQAHRGPPPTRPLDCRLHEQASGVLLPCCVSASQGVRRVCWPLVLVCVIACCCVLRAVCWCCLLLRAQSALAIHNSTASSPSTCLPGNDYIDYEA